MTRCDQRRNAPLAHTSIGLLLQTSIRAGDFPIVGVKLGYLVRIVQVSRVHQPATSRLAPSGQKVTHLRFE